MLLFKTWSTQIFSLCSIKSTTTCALIYNDQVLLTHEGFRYWPTGCLLPWPAPLPPIWSPADDLGCCFFGAAGLAWQCATESNDDKRSKGYRKGKENSQSCQIRKQLKHLAIIFWYLLINSGHFLWRALNVSVFYFSPFLTWEDSGIVRSRFSPQSVSVGCRGQPSTTARLTQGLFHFSPVIVCWPLRS